MNVALSGWNLGRGIRLVHALVMGDYFGTGWTASTASSDVRSIQRAATATNDSD